MSLLPIVVPIVQTITEQALSGSPVDGLNTNNNRNFNQDLQSDMDEKTLNLNRDRDDIDLEFRGRSPNYGRKDVQFRSFPTNSTWSSNFSTAINTTASSNHESRIFLNLRSGFRKIWNFIFRRDDSQSIDDVVPYYRWLPILSGVTIPFSILLQIPGCTERWYVRTLDNQTVQSRPNPPILLAGNIVAMVAALIANICLITRFLEKKVKRMTIISLCLLSIHDIINAVTVTIFGIEHRFNDGFTYGQPFWLVVASTVVSLFTTVTLLWDLWKTPDFSKSGSGLTRKQRSLVIIVMVLLCWITFGGLVNSILLHLTYIDGLYFTVVSIETIGFGDIHPDSTSSRIFAIIYNSIGIITIGIAISTARETIIESFEVSYRLRLNEVAQRRGEFKKIKERERTRKHVIERILRTAGLPGLVPDPAKPGKMKLNEEALTPEQVLNAEKETIFLMNRRYQHQLRGASAVGAGGGPSFGEAVTGASGVTFERTFSLDSTVSDIVNSQMYEENYRDFKANILREERREFAAKITIALAIFLLFWLIGAVIFSQTEKWDYGISLYFCFVAFSSIGYGDYAPATPAGRSVFVVWALLGVGAMTILVSVLCEACSSRYKSALSGGSFQRAVKNFRKRREVSPSPHFHHRVHSQTRTPPSYSQRLHHNSASAGGGYTQSPGGLVSSLAGTPASPLPSHEQAQHLQQQQNQQQQQQQQMYTLEQAKRDLEALPSELLNHAQTFHDHVYYFMSSLDGADGEPLPAPLEKLLNEMAESEHMAEGLRREVLRDDGARRALFMMSYEGALKKMIQTAQRAVTLLSRRDLLNTNNNNNTSTTIGRRDNDAESKISKLSAGLDLEANPTVATTFEEQRYLPLRRQSPLPPPSVNPSQNASTGVDPTSILGSGVR